MTRVLTTALAFVLGLTLAVLPAGPVSAAHPPGTVQVSTYDVYGLALSAGRVTYYNRSTRGYPVLTRRVTVGDSIALGAPSLIGLSQASPADEGRETAVLPGSTSGARTVWTQVTERNCYENGIICWVDGSALRLSRGGAVQHTFDPPYGRGWLSGTRAVHQVGSKWFLHDLRTRTRQQLSARAARVNQAFLAKGRPVALAGENLVLAWNGFVSYPSDDVGIVAEDYSIRLKDLAVGGASSVIAPTPADPPGRLSKATVSAWGGWVAWDRQYQEDGVPSGRDCGLRNVDTMAPATELDVCAVELTSDGILGRDKVAKTWTLQPYDGAPAPLPIPYDATDVSVDNGVMAWIGADRKARLAPVPSPTTYRPRSLGNRLVAGSFVIGRSSWYLDIVATAPLTTCEVLVKKKGNLVRTLACDPSRMAVGEVVAHWNGKDSQGGTVPRTGYNWVVHAGNHDGTLLATTGQPGPHAGIVIAK